MEEIWVIGSVILGFVLRIGVPLLITILIGRGLRKLDAKWKEDGQKVRIQDLSISDRTIDRMTCWEFFDCSEEKRKNCKMYDQTGVLCWEICQKIGEEPSECLACKYKEVMEKEIVPTVNITFRD